MNSSRFSSLICPVAVSHCIAAIHSASVSRTSRAKSCRCRTSAVISSARRGSFAVAQRSTARSVMLSSVTSCTGSSCGRDAAGGRRPREMGQGVSTSRAPAPFPRPGGARPRPPRASGSTSCATASRPARGVLDDRGQGRRAARRASGRCWCSRGPRPMRLRSTAEENSATSPEAPPRLTSRPRSASTREAAVAATPNTGSTTTSTRPPHASWNRAVSCVDVAGRAATTSSAPAARARSWAVSDRQTATTRPAPSTRAAPMAAWPTAPPRAEHEHPLPRPQPGPAR